MKRRIFCVVDELSDSLAEAMIKVKNQRERGYNATYIVEVKKIYQPDFYVKAKKMKIEEVPTTRTEVAERSPFGESQLNGTASIRRG